MVNLVSDQVSIDEALAMPALAWDVKEVTIPDFPDYKAIVHPNTGKVFGVTNKTWKPVTNRDAFNWLQPLIDTNRIQYDTAVVMRGGEVVAISTKVVGAVYDVVKDDPVQLYLVFFNGNVPHKLGLGGVFHNKRLLCANMMAAIISKARGRNDMAASGLTFRHTSKVMERLAMATSAIEAQLDAFQEERQVMQSLAQKRISREDYVNYLNHLFNISPDGDKKQPRFFEKLTNNFSEPDNPVLENTAYWAYQSITQWLTHERGSDRDNSKSRYHNNLFGQNRVLLNKAYRLCVQTFLK